ncbi:MAG: 30S ribosomal protein S6 [Candidatus Dadabacteria bacterium]|nr:MAG: 30S ribosomal protein S6 [Candidatus Dadabacteria bacterium]
MMRQYETILIFKNELSQEQIKAELDRIEAFLAKHGAVNISAESWGKRELAHEINSQRHGTYIRVSFETANHDIIAELTAILRITESLITFQSHRLGAKVRKYKGYRKALHSAEENELSVQMNN